jgi:hypothetical protein
MAPDTLDLSDLFSRLYHTSISPDSVRTSMMVCGVDLMNPFRP